jgi:hypothetical protein
MMSTLALAFVLALGTACDPVPPPEAAGPAAAVEQVPTEPEGPSPLHAVPPLPAGVLLQVFCRETGQLERFMDDGRWLVQEPGGELLQRAPRSYYEPDGELLSEDALRRVRQALDEVGFLELPTRVDSPAAGRDLLLTGGQGPVRLQVHAFSVMDAAGAPHTVEVEGDLRALESFGALQPLVHSLDREAWGRFLLE